jgi:aspartyl-tRNA(Asn)/glutamyl-tRNA(Gln) amidotransferase subunit A
MMLDATAVRLAAAVRSREISALEIAEAMLVRVEERNEALGAYLTVAGEAAQARRVDARIAAGESLPLAGVPAAIKDNMCLTGTRTTCASKILANWVAPYTATAVARCSTPARCRSARRTSTSSRWAARARTARSASRRTPTISTRVPGGSSGGSAAAVGGIATIALGSDTGGSIREPAAFCNVVGFKPTYGRVSRYGLIAFASSLDQIGPFARRSKTRR